VLRYRSVTHIHAAEILRDFADDFKVLLHLLPINGRKPPLQIGVVNQIRGGVYECFESHGDLQSQGQQPG
jgi:hypothetical protein